MDTLKQKAMFDAIESGLREIGCETAYAEGAEEQNGRTLQFTLDLRLESEDVKLVSELRQLDIDDDLSSLQLLTTVLPKAGPGLPELERAVARWNLYTIIGAYGIFYPESSLYHRYHVLVTSDREPGDAMLSVVDALCCVQQELAYTYHLALALSAGELNMDTAIEKGYMPD